ncbi:MAG: hypothetical protein P8181_11815 [bacterium]
MRNPISVCVLVIIGMALMTTAVPASHAEIVLDTAFPVEKEATRIHVVGPDGGPVADAAVTATYRPGSAVATEVEVGRTGVDGNCEWVPGEAGIVTIGAAWVDGAGVEQTTAINVSVKYDHAPIEGIVIMIVAGIVLIGGAIQRIARLLGTPEPE